MYAVVFILRPTHDDVPGGADAAALTDIIWSHAVPIDSLQYVHVSAVVDHAEVTLFVQGVDLACAERAAHELCQRVIDRTPVLSDWVVHPF